MNITLGFGSCEQEQRKLVYSWIHDTIKEIYNNRDDKALEYFDDETKSTFICQFNNFKKQIHEKYEEAHGASDKPERYYHIEYGTRIAWDYDTLFMKINFWHINSKHPMSPDGMALMKHSETFTISCEQLN